MLRALKVATELYLEGPLLDPEVVVSFSVINFFFDAFRSVCFSLSLSMFMFAQPSAGVLAARANGIGGQCINGVEIVDFPNSNQQQDPEQLILTVDYSRAAMTALLVVEECSVFEYRHVLHDIRLGIDELLIEPARQRC